MMLRCIPATTRYHAFTGLLVGAIMLSGCMATETRWTHGEIPAEEWGVDAAQCKWEARRKAEKEAEDAMAYNTNDSLDDEQSIDSLFASIDRNDRARELFDRCMQSLGYVAAD